MGDRGVLCRYVEKKRGVGMERIMERGVGMQGWRGVYCMYVGKERGEV